MADRILILSPDTELRIFLSSILRESGYDVHSLASPEEGVEYVSAEGEELRLVFLDAGEGPLPRGGPALLEAVKLAAPGLPVLLLTESGAYGVGAAHALGAAGAIHRGDYVKEPAPVTMKKIASLTRTVEEAGRRFLKDKGLGRSLAYYEAYFREKYRPVGRSEAFGKIIDQARRLASIPRPVLIRGERGTGKELVAGAIHFMGPRAKAPFVTVNCAAFHGDLLESEMFGHEKGAFTGADRRKIGRFELADGGTLFLDEIGNMSLDFQAKILRVIEYQEFERVAGTEKIIVDIRVIAATNADLGDRMREGGFREDLYDRLTFAVIEVPPLRERPEDIEVLAEAFSRRIVDEVPGLRSRSFPPEVIRKFKAYGWPGNVRELKNVVERLTCREGDAKVTIADLPPEILTPEKPLRTFSERVDAFQIELLFEALQACNGSQKKAAALLGLTYDQFRHMVRKFDLTSRLE